MTKTEWHGWKRDNLLVAVGHLPGRKSACLYVEEENVYGGAVIEVLAYFADETRARHALEAIDRLIAPRSVLVTNETCG